MKLFIESGICSLEFVEKRLGVVVLKNSTMVAIGHNGA